MGLITHLSLIWLLLVLGRVVLQLKGEMAVTSTRFLCKKTSLFEVNTLRAMMFSHRGVV